MCVGERVCVGEGSVCEQVRESVCVLARGERVCV